jgi:hypothetical protein
MVSARLKGTAVVTAFVGLAGVVMWQQTRIAWLIAENTSLKKQAQEETLARQIAERQRSTQPSHQVRSNSILSPSVEPSGEVLRLRGEVKVLRAQLTEAQLHPSEDAISRTSKETELRLVEDYAGSLQQRLSELTPALDVPEAVAKMDSQEGLTDTNLMHYRPYFQAKAALDEWLKRRESLRQSVAPTG